MFEPAWNGPETAALGIVSRQMWALWFPGNSRDRFGARGAYALPKLVRISAPYGSRVKLMGGGGAMMTGMRSPKRILRPSSDHVFILQMGPLMTRESLPCQHFSTQTLGKVTCR